MSCPEIRSVLEGRMKGQDPQGWPQTMAHLKSCSTCREQALQLDPLLALGALAPPLPVSVDIAEMKSRVHALRKNSELEQSIPSSWSRLSRKVRTVGSLAALMVLGILMNPYQEPASSNTQGMIRVDIEPSAEVDEEILALLFSQPVVEVDYGDNGPEQVMEWDGQDLTVALLVDERFDV